MIATNLAAPVPVNEPFPGTDLRLFERGAGKSFSITFWSPEKPIGGFVIPGKKVTVTSTCPACERAKFTMWGRHIIRWRRVA